MPERLDRAGELSRMVWALGLGDRLVGRDTATDFPGAADLPQVTPGGHTINAESILKLRPDVVLTDGSIGPSRVLDTLTDAGIPVVRIPDERTPDTIADLATQVATAVGLGEQGEKAGAAIVDKLDAATRDAQTRADGRRMMVLYLRGTTVAMIASTSTPSTGEKAPMPPVFGPVSPSPIRLKSRAGASGTAPTPSHSASSESSGPTMCSSTTTAPGPKTSCSSIAWSVSRACASSVAITTPLPAASPSNFSTTG